MENTPFKRGQSRFMTYSQLKDSIQYLSLMPGSRINENELAAQMGVSRTPIREALIRLSEEYLVNIFPQSGTYVAPISFELSKEAAYMRHLLDLDICIKLCKERVDATELLDEQMYFMNAAVRRKDVVEYIRRDEQFHGALFAYAGHGTIWNIIANSRAHYNRVLMLDLQRPNKLEESFAAHHSIIRYIAAGDETALRTLLYIHHDQNLDESFESELGALYPEYFVSV